MHGLVFTGVGFGPHCHIVREEHLGFTCYAALLSREISIFREDLSGFSEARCGIQGVFQVASSEMLLDLRWSLPTSSHKYTGPALRFARCTSDVLRIDLKICSNTLLLISINLSASASSAHLPLADRHIELETLVASHSEFNTVH